MGQTKLRRVRNEYNATAAAQREEGLYLTDRDLLQRMIEFGKDSRYINQDDFSSTTKVQGPGLRELRSSIGEIRSRFNMSESQRITEENFATLVEQYGEDSANAALEQFTRDSVVLQRWEQAANLNTVRETAASIKGGADPGEARVAVLAALADAEKRRGAAQRTNVALRRATQGQRARAATPSAAQQRSVAARQSREGNTTSGNLFSSQSLSRRNLLRSNY